MQRNREREPGNRRGGQEELPGIIDTIGSAFSLLNQRPYLIWPPIVLDLFLWLGLRLSAEPMVDRIHAWLAPQLASDDQFLTLLSDLKHSNLLVLLAIMMPSLLRELGGSSIAGSNVAGSIGILDWWVLPAISLLLITFGSFIGVAYLTMIGYLLRGQPLRVGLVPEALRNFVRTVGFILAAIAAFLLVAMPLLVFTAVVMVIGVNITAFTSLILTIGVIWYLLMTFFALYAVIVSGSGPFRAMYLSYNVVRANFWPSVGFIFAFLLIRHGVPIALHLFTRSPWGVPFAVVANAYFATGITAAAMLFYRERARALVQNLTTPSHSTHRAS